MKLNKECVRSIMLFCESNLQLGNQLTLQDFLNNSELNYTDDDIEYSLEKLDETPYLNMQLISGSNNGIAQIFVNSITWEGHEFLDTIRDPKVWKATKKIASHLESVSIKILSNIGTGVINHLIDKNMSNPSFWNKIDL